MQKFRSLYPVIIWKRLAYFNWQVDSSVRRGFIMDRVSSSARIGASWSNVAQSLRLRFPSRGHVFDECHFRNVCFSSARTISAIQSLKCPEKSPVSGGTASSDKNKVLRTKTPIGKLDELGDGPHPYQEKEPLPPWPDNTNPHSGEVGGPKGPEPTRYGDWERKGRVTDF